MFHFQNFVLKSATKKDQHPEPPTLLQVLSEEDRGVPARVAASEGDMSAVISALENIQVHLTQCIS